MTQQPDSIDDVLRTAPRWVTAELTEETLTVCRKYYGPELTPAEALEIIINVGRFVDVAKMMQARERQAGR